MSAEPGVKKDDGKARWTLLPMDQVEYIVRVLMFGARKYPAADNWKRVDNARERYLDAAFRHLAARARGEVLDPETGLPHLAHLCCCGLFAMWFDDEELKP